VSTSFSFTISVLKDIIANEYLYYRLGQGGAALFPFMTGQIASKVGVIGMMPFTLGLSLAMLFSWIFIPSTGPTINVLTVYKRWKLRRRNRKADVETDVEAPCEKLPSSQA
jgi:hypothetical protein